MIDELDSTIEQLLRHELPPALVDQIAVSFDAPGSGFPPAAVTLPAVNLFLYDIRENLDLRSNEWFVDELPNGTYARRRSPVAVDCSYMITAWSSESSTTRAIDEHRLLSAVMKALLRYPTIPNVLLQGSLAEQEPPLPAAALQPSRLQSVGELWQALGGKPKAALNYTVTIGVMASRTIGADLLVTEKVLKLRPDVKETR